MKGRCETKTAATELYLTSRKRGPQLRMILRRFQNGSIQMASDDEDLDTPSCEIATPRPASRFAPPKSDSEVKQARLQAIPTSTKKDTAWCFNIWRLATVLTLIL